MAGGSVIAVKAFFGTHPEDAIGVLIKAVDEIAADACAVVGIVAEGLETIAVESVESVLGAEPEKSPLILQATDDGIVGEAVLYLVMSEIVRLTGEGMGSEQEDGKYDRFGVQYGCS